VRQLQERIQQTEFVEQQEGRGVDGVPAEVAEEVDVLLEDDDVHALPREEKPEHHAGRAAAGDDCARGHAVLGSGGGGLARWCSSRAGHG
jgi:hypothetical protein